MNSTKDVRQPHVIDLGWANSWTYKPAILRRCREQDHPRSHVDHSHGRGLDNEVRCDICGYVYRYDSSD